MAIQKLIRRPAHPPAPNLEKPHVLGACIGTPERARFGKMPKINPPHPLLKIGRMRHVRITIVVLKTRKPMFC